MKLYHVERDHAVTLERQKKALAARYSGFVYICCYRNVITFTAE